MKCCRCLCPSFLMWHGSSETIFTDFTMVVVDDLGESGRGFPGMSVCRYAMGHVTWSLRSIHPMRPIINSDHIPMRPGKKLMANHSAPVNIVNLCESSSICTKLFTIPEFLLKENGGVFGGLETKANLNQAASQVSGETSTEETPRHPRHPALTETEKIWENTLAIAQIS